MPSVSRTQPWRPPTPTPGPAMGNRPMGGARCSVVPAEGPAGSCLALMLEHHCRRAFKQPRLPSRPGRLPPHPPCGAPSRPGAAPRGQLLPMRPWAGAFPSGGERAGCRWQELIKVGTAQAPRLCWLETPWAAAGCGGWGEIGLTLLPKTQNTGPGGPPNPASRPLEPERQGFLQLPVSC